jgi:hypothetical protein
MPVADAMAAIPVPPLVHVPPVVALARVTDAPAQTVEGPVMAAGNALTVSTADTAQPVALMV